MNFGPLNFNVIQGGNTDPMDSPPTIESAIAAQYIGRYQIGESVPLEFKTVGLSDFATTGAVEPDSVPLVRVYSSGITARSTAIPVDTTNLSATGIFRGKFTLGSLDSAGHYYTLFMYNVDGESKVSLSCFEVLTGGHRNGSTISSCYFNQPSGNIFIAHEESGVVSQGLRPYLDTGD